MSKPLLSTIMAASVAALALTPATASAGDRHGRYDNYGYYDRGHHHGRRHHDDDDDGAAIAAGVIGLALGLALGAAAADSDNSRREADCYDNYQRCAPPAGYAGPQGYDSGYSAYEEDYGRDYSQAQQLAGPPPTPQYAAPTYVGGGACIHQEQIWDPRAGRYVVVNVRRPCE